MFRRAKAIQVRGIPDEKYDALVEAARIEDLPLDKYVLQELEYVARLPRVTQDRTALIRRTQKRIRGAAGRRTILAMLDESRDSYERNDWC